MGLKKWKKKKREKVQSVGFTKSKARLVALLPFFCDLLSSSLSSFSLHLSLSRSLVFLSLSLISLSSFFEQRQLKTKKSFKLLQGGTQKFEVREYAPAVWSTAAFPAGTSWDEVRSKGFDRNFKYIQGAGVAMTAPVVSVSESEREKRDARKKEKKVSKKNSLSFRTKKKKNSTAHPPLRRRLLLSLLPRPFEIRHLPSGPETRLRSPDPRVPLAPRCREVLGRHGSEIRVEERRRRRVRGPDGRRRRRGPDRRGSPERRGPAGLDCRVRLADDGPGEEEARGVAAAGGEEERGGAGGQGKGWRRRNDGARRCRLRSSAAALGQAGRGKGHRKSLSEGMREGALERELARNSLQASLEKKVEAPYSLSFLFSFFVLIVKTRQRSSVGRLLVLFWLVRAFLFIAREAGEAEVPGIRGRK